MRIKSRHTRTFLLILIAVLVMSCSTEKDIYLFTSFREPATEGLYLAYSEDGYHWEDLEGPYLKPQIGKSGIMRDPSIIKGKDNMYHMVWTTEWRGGTGFGYATSKDLINWSEQQYIPVMAEEPDVVNVWAPEIFYDDVKDRYIIIWASTVPFKFEKGIEEEDNNHRMYYTTTKDFKSFTDTKLFFNPGYSVIDCVLVKMAKGEYVLVLKDNTRPMRNLKIAFSKSPLGPFSTSSEPFSDFLSEGPTVLQQNGEWIIYFDNYGAKDYQAVRTSDFQEFENISDEIKLPDGHKHGTITTISRSILKGLLNKKDQF